MYCYSYNNGEYSLHKRIIGNKTMIKEAKGATGVSIYKLNDLDIEYILNGKRTGKLIATLILN